MVASGTGVRIAYNSGGETTHGTTPASPQFIVLRGISRNINLKKDTLESEEVSSSRQRADVRHGFHRIEGDIEVELGMTSFNDWLLWTTGTVAWFAATTVTNTSTLSVTGTNSFTRGAGNWITDNYRPGDWVRSTGFPNAANNGDFRVTGVTTTVLTVTGTLVNEAGDGDSQVAYIGQKTVVSNVGQTLKTFSLEREILDLDAAGIDLYQIYRGVAINTLRCSAEPGSIVRANFGLTGMTADIDQSLTLDTNSIYSAAPTNSPFAGLDATVYNGGFSHSATAFEFTIDNQRTTQGMLGQKTTLDIYEGIHKSSGTTTILLQNTTNAAAFQNESTQELGYQIRFLELGTGEFLTFNWYKVKYTAFEIDPPQNGPISQVINWEGLAKSFNDGTTTTIETMHIQRSV